jgi:hypothetical protein
MAKDIFPECLDAPSLHVASSGAFALAQQARGRTVFHPNSLTATHSTHFQAQAPDGKVVDWLEKFSDQEYPQR